MIRSLKAWRFRSDNVFFFSFVNWFLNIRCVYMFAKKFNQLYISHMALKFNQMLHYPFPPFSIYISRHRPLIFCFLSLSFFFHFHRITNNFVKTKCIRLKQWNLIWNVHWIWHMFRCFIFNKICFSLHNQMLKSLAKETLQFIFFWNLLIINSFAVKRMTCQIFVFE